MPNPLTQVQPALEFLPPNLNPLLLKIIQPLLPFWLRSQTAIAGLEAENIDQLVDLYQEFQQGKIRFLMAFRHPSTDDPYCLGYLVWHLLPKVAKARGISLQSPLHFHFIYDRGIPLWAGQKVGWLYSQLGGTPILRGKLDRMGLRSVRELFVNGKLPMAAAPEGATNGHNEVVSPLEPGIAQMSFWCVEDLAKAGRDETVFIVPIGIQYRYVEAPWDAVDQLLTQLEFESGLSPLELSTLTTEKTNELEKIRYQRLIRLGNHVLGMMEDFYRQFYHQNLPIIPPDEQNLSVRLSALLDVALKIAEQYFNVPSKGSLIDRCRRLEQAGWDRIYREDIKDVEALSALERGLADRIAEEASLRMWHMRLVESFVAVTGNYVREKLTAERFAETTLLLSDVMTRIKGGNPFNRPKLGKQRAYMTVGEPISISQRAEAYKNNRRTAVADLTKDLQTALEKMIL